MQHVRPVSDEGRPINRDLDGFPVTCRLLTLSSRSVSLFLNIREVFFGRGG